jgi:hypothetical protein
MRLAPLGAALILACASAADAQITPSPPIVATAAPPPAVAGIVRLALVKVGGMRDAQTTTINWLMSRFNREAKFWMVCGIADQRNFLVTNREGTGADDISSIEVDDPGTPPGWGGRIQVDCDTLDGEIVGALPK